MVFKKIKANKEMNNILHLRKVIAGLEGKIGLFWLNKDMTNVIPYKKISVKELADDNVTVPEYYATQKTHDMAFEEFSEKFIIDNGGVPHNKYSLPRGFIVWRPRDESFHIIGGDWLNEKNAELIANEFGIPNSENVYLTINKDYNVDGNKK